MAVSALSPQDSAGERDDRLTMVALAIEAGARDAYEYRLGAHDALEAARWAAAADPDDPRIAGLLSTAAQLAAAVTMSIVATEELQLPISGKLRAVPAGLPPEAITAVQWADAIWAATATGDAASAVSLARRESPVDAEGAPAGEVELARAVAALWRGDPVGPHLIRALGESDPDDASGAERDRRLDVTTPAIAAFRHLLDGRSGDVRESLVAASESFARYWNAPPRRTQPGRALSLPLSGLVRLAVETGQGIDTLPHGVPAGLLAGSVLLCPVCASPFDELESSCRWCGTDLARDAPLEQRLGEFVGAEARACPVCARPNRAAALRCWHCSTSLLTA